MSFFPFHRRRAASAHWLPRGLRVYAIGDVHGCDDCLVGVEGRIADELAERPLLAGDEAVVIFLGDYIDRGPASAAVIERLLTRSFAGLPTRTLLGNHEDALLHFLVDPVRAAEWLDWGGIETLASYGVAAGSTHNVTQLRELAAVAGEAIPNSHLSFLRDLEPAVVLGDFLFVHAGIRPGVALDRQRRGDLLWMREPFLSDPRLHPYRVVHGHTISDEVEILPNRIGLDTGAYATGRLSAVVIEDDLVAVLP